MELSGGRGGRTYIVVYYRIVKSYIQLSVFLAFLRFCGFLTSARICSSILFRTFLSVCSSLVSIRHSPYNLLQCPLQTSKTTLISVCLDVRSHVIRNGDYHFYYKQSRTNVSLTKNFFHRFHRLIGAMGCCHY